MASFKAFLKSGHPRTLFSAFLYFDFCFAIWVVNGAMAPFISEQFHLTPVETGFMLSVPVLAGALMRFPTGLLAQYITRRWAAVLEMSMIVVGLSYGYFFVDTYQEVIWMGIPLGIAGASFGIALSLGGGWFPPQYKGLAIGIAGAGNSGAVIAMLTAPLLAAKYGWQSVYGFYIILMLIPIFFMIFWAKEPPDQEKKKLSDYLKVLFEKDAWVFNIVYIVSFGGYIGFTSFLPTFFVQQYGVSKATMGQFSAVIVIMASIFRIAGGWAADRWGGIRVLNVLFFLIIASLFAVATLPSIWLAVLTFVVIFSALGTVNGSTFQLVPLRFPYATPVAMSLVGEVGALGGGFLPNAMGYSKQYMGSFSGGFIAFAVFSIFAFALLYASQHKWQRTWVGEGGKPLAATRKVPAGEVA